FLRHADETDSAGSDLSSVLRVKVTAEAARRFLLARHFLAPARSLAGGADGVLEVIGKLGSIQFDPIAVAGRNHDLVLHARVAGYEPAWCDALYECREIFEATNKALSFVPTSEFPWFRHVMGRKGPRFHGAALAENAAVAERVLGRIRAEGALSTRDFVPEHGAPKDWFGMPENAVRAVLEAYTVTGVIGLARRDGNLRYYDLLERLLPAEVLTHEVPEREQLRHKLLSRYRAHGLLGAGGAGGTFARITPPQQRNELRKELVELGALVPVDIEGVRGKRLVLAEEVALLQAPPEPASSVAFIAPFDSLLWDTALLSSLFGYDYVWEGFFPPAKRRWGYYVLPVVFGDRFAGRIEPRIDRDQARVEVLNVWWEDGFEPRRADGFIEAMRDALRAYLRFAGADCFEWAPHLTMEERLFPARP
ncbi:MAG: DNA glycosylase AlkZ-like family protein, partial [Thermoleophilaceae bacterium]